MCVSYFLELTALPDWLGNLASLRELELIDCPDLAYVPVSIRHLTNLRKLIIESCPELEKTCEREVGADWHKIAHIPDVYLGPRQHRSWGGTDITNYKHQISDYQSSVGYSPASFEFCITLNISTDVARRVLPNMVMSRLRLMLVATGPVTRVRSEMQFSSVIF
ncbi:hypothetical protein TIFTF001_055203 [Ficus carica]|uniref:Uncharacterized protein n=1 Tax=Ficus carica TaxID=3494 RepID=A0AA88EJ80_FICCA|nr:hypothetical protein TIFTF001_055202 [Ficus carica]GMN71975.1 hypothetical protein TIFTF001_055203 [Ficus carica]